MIRELDENGDITGGIFAYKQEAIASEIKCKLQQFKAENPFNLDEGIDWTNELPRVDEPKLRVLIEDVILSTSGATGFESRVALEYDRIERVLNVTCDVRTIYSPTLKIEVNI